MIYNIIGVIFLLSIGSIATIGNNLLGIIGLLVTVVVALVTIARAKGE